MITPLSNKELKRDFGVEFVNSRKLSQFGGLSTFIQFLQRAKIKEQLTDLFGERTALAILQVSLGIIVGAESMEEIYKASKDPMIKDYLGKVVSETQIKRTFEKMKKSQIAALHEFSLSLAILDIIDGVRKGDPLFFDLDATAVEKHGNQEGVEFGYHSNDEIKKGYQYLFVRNHNLNNFLYGTIRAGSTHSQNDFCGYLQQILNLFGGEWNLKIRGDSGFFNERAIGICLENNVDIYLKAPMSGARRAQAQSEKLVWFKENPEDEVEYASYTTSSEASGTWREVFKRIPMKSDQPSLFCDYEYHCVATNDLSCREWEAFTIYNGRSNIENNIKEMKYDYSLGSIVTQSFDVNDVITQATMIAYQLISHFVRTCFDKKDRRRRLSTVRSRFFNIPARILSTSGYTWYRVQHAFLDHLCFSRIFARIKHLQSIFLNPYLLAVA